MSDKRIVLVSSGKGGVGKSRWSSAFADHLRNERRRPVALFDADGLVGGLVRVHGQRNERNILLPEQDPRVGCAFYNIRSSERSALVNSASTGADLILHDLAGGSMADISRVMGDDLDLDDGIERLVKSFDRRGYRATIVHVLSPDPASTSSVGEHVELFGSKVDHVVVRNRFWGREFPWWTGFTDGLGVKKGGKTRATFFEAGGIEIEMPALPSGTAAKIDAENMPPSRAKDDAVFDIQAQDHCFNFLEEYAASLKPAANLLGLG